MLTTSYTTLFWSLVCITIIYVIVMLSKFLRENDELGPLDDAPTRKHIGPQCRGHQGGFANITECEDCGTRALYEDRHPANPCPSCGGNLLEKVGIFKFDTHEWCVRENKI